MGRVVYSCLLLIRLRVSARYSDHGCPFGRSCYEVHGACDVRINLYPAAPIRLAKVLLAWTIAQEGWDSSMGRQIGKCRFAMLLQQPHIRPARHTRLGCRNSAHCRTLSCEGRALRNQTLLEITPEGNGDLARHCNDHDALNAPVLPFGPLHSMAQKSLSAGAVELVARSICRYLLYVQLRLGRRRLLKNYDDLRPTHSIFGSIPHAASDQDVAGLPR